MDNLRKAIAALHRLPWSFTNKLIQERGVSNDALFWN